MQTVVTATCDPKLRCKAKTNQSTFLCRAVSVSMYQRQWFYMQCTDSRQIRRRGGFLIDIAVIDDLGIFINDSEAWHVTLDLTQGAPGRESFVTSSNGNKPISALELYRTPNYISVYPVVKHGKRTSLYRMDVPNTDIIQMCNFVKEWSLFYETR